MVKDTEGNFEKEGLNLNIRKGALHQKLGIPEDEKIPDGILSDIKGKTVGERINVRGKSVPVTDSLKREANLAQNMKEWK